MPDSLQPRILDQTAGQQLRGSTGARVSLGVPVYNGGRFLAESLESLLAQTYQDFEIVISDNGSTDDTAEICRAFAERDERVRHFRVEENRGASWNFQNVFHLTAAPTSSGRHTTTCWPRHTSSAAWRRSTQPHARSCSSTRRRVSSTRRGLPRGL